jgi:hypothetical protein
MKIVPAMWHRDMVLWYWTYMAHRGPLMVTWCGHQCVVQVHGLSGMSTAQTGRDTAQIYSIIYIIYNDTYI